MSVCVFVCSCTIGHNSKRSSHKLHTVRHLSKEDLISFGEIRGKVKGEPRYRPKFTNSTLQCRAFLNCLRFKHYGAAVGALNA